MLFLLYNTPMPGGVSIIISTFNEEEYLPNLLKSLQNQTVTPKEIIVSDAFSTDQTRTIAKLFSCKIVDGGQPPKARNEGAKVALGDMLLFLDADVILPKNFLERSLSEVQRKKLDIASCYVTPLSHLKVDHMLHSLVNYYLKFTVKFSPHISGSCIFVKKRLHKKIHGFNEALVFAEDHDYVKRAKKIGKFAYLKSYKIPISVRRLSEEGRLKIVLKYVAIEIHLFLLGNITNNVVAYDYGKHYK